LFVLVTVFVSVVEFVAANTGVATSARIMRGAAMPAMVLVYFMVASN